jgi:peptidoglycan/xylan/chitin deacetylase (PgdA/CDA1 family)
MRKAAMAALWVLTLAGALPLLADSPAAEPTAKAGPPDGAPLVSVVFDDGWVSAFEHAVPIMDAMGLRGTHFVHAGFVDRPGFQGDHMNSELLAILHAKGHEIGSHAMDTDWKDQMSDPALMEAQLAESKARLESFGFEVAGFAPPNGAFDSEVIDKTRQYYDYMRTIDYGINYVDTGSERKLKCYAVTDRTSPATLRDWIRWARSTDGWLVLLYHRFADQIPAGADTYVTPEDFQAQMETLVKAGALVLPMREALEVWRSGDLLELQ